MSTPTYQGDRERGIFSLFDAEKRLIDYYGLHSPDDLVYCSSYYDRETNRRIFFNGL
ncbi:MAG: hypothetical protein QM730_21725 [Anaerolineales bacterium]